MSAIRLLVVVLTLITLSPVTAASAAEALPGATYTALPTPARILDTRTDVGGHHARIGPAETVTVAVPGLPVDATAVVINLTGTGGTASTFLSTFPSEFTGTSTLNLAAGQTAAVAAFVTVGTNKSINIRNNSGTVDVVADLVGYFAAATGAAFAPAPSPTRILDTRASSPLGSGEVRTLPVRGTAGVPANATAVVVNLTGVTPTLGTFLAVTPDGRPGTSTLNLDPGATRANLAVVGIGSDGAIRISNFRGSTHVVADVQGWFGPGEGGRYMTLPTPQRVLDTRNGNAPVGPGLSTMAPFAGVGGVPTNGRLAVLFNLTGVQPSENTVLTAWPHGRTRPLASNVNLAAGTIVPNAAIVDTSTVDIHNLRGTTHVVVDAAGYFYTPTRSNPTVPGAPTVIGTRATGDQVTVAWSPADDGGVPLVGYTATAQPGGRTVTVDAGTHSATFRGLATGVMYTMTVTATNLIGTGPASAPSDPISPLMTRIDTDAAGAPDPAAHYASVKGVSADGRYVLMAVDGDFNAAAVRRKDVRTGQVVLVSVDERGQPLASQAQGGMSEDGNLVAYASVLNDNPSVVYVHDLAAHTVRAVFTGPPRRNLYRFAFSSDGHWLSWLSEDNQGNHNRIIYRHDLRTNQTTEVLACADPVHGCHIDGGLEVADDGRTFLFGYRSAPGGTAQVTLLDADSGQLRTLFEAAVDTGYTLSGDGNWVFYNVGHGCVSCGVRVVQLKRIATAPGATPVVLRSWEDDVTLTVEPTSASDDGSLIGYSRVANDGRIFNTPVYLHDVATGRQIEMPQPSDTTYLTLPAMLSGDGNVLAVHENCLGADCFPNSPTYVVWTPALRAG